MAQLESAPSKAGPAAIVTASRYEMVFPVKASAAAASQPGIHPINPKSSDIIPVEKLSDKSRERPSTAIPMER